MSGMRFQLMARDGAARRGRLHFPRGTVEAEAARFPALATERVNCNTQRA